MPATPPPHLPTTSQSPLAELPAPTSAIDGQPTTAFDPKDELSDKDSLVMLRGAIRSLILTLPLDRQGTTVNSAWALLDEETRSRRRGQTGLPTLEDGAAVLVEALGRLGLEYIEALPAWRLKVDGVLRLQHPERLIAVFPAAEFDDKSNPLRHRHKVLKSRLN